jgi:hypothetical protein
MSSLHALLAGRIRLSVAVHSPLRCTIRDAPCCHGVCPCNYSHALEAIALAPASSSVPSVVMCVTPPRRVVVCPQGLPQPGIANCTDVYNAGFMDALTSSSAVDECCRKDAPSLRRMRRGKGTCAAAPVPFVGRTWAAQAGVFRRRATVATPCVTSVICCDNTQARFQSTGRWTVTSSRRVEGGTACDGSTSTTTRLRCAGTTR